MTHPGVVLVYGYDSFSSREKDYGFKSQTGLQGKRFILKMI